MLFFAGFLLLGLGVGLLGTLVGAGGGFILTPLLLLIFPEKPSQIITATSLSVVGLNALSGSIAYFRLGRIDLKTSLTYSLAASPWVVLGVFFTSKVNRGPFDIMLGMVLLALCVALFRRPAAEKNNSPSSNDGMAPRRIIDRAGHVYEYRFRFRLGIWISTVVGFLSSFFGIGGGALYVSMMIQFLRVPPHIATATTQALLFVTVAIAVLVHFLQGHLSTMGDLVLPLAIGVIAGAQGGAYLSQKLGSNTLKRVLALLLVLVSVQLLYKGTLFLWP
ncbi:MAG: sulfite exporter TauE/SafE family protein [bacterium]|nr:sulfite exporter TauE/SafE family protein [bacterium]